MEIQLPGRAGAWLRARACIARVIVLGCAGFCTGWCRWFGGDNPFPAPDRLVAVGDVHGDYAALVEVLLAARVIDDEQSWIGGSTHLVSIGDLLIVALRAPSWTC